MEKEERTNIVRGDFWLLSANGNLNYFTIGLMELLLKPEQQEPYDGRLSRTVL